jgi:hypothetical protein
MSWPETMTRSMMTKMPGPPRNSVAKIIRALLATERRRLGTAAVTAEAHILEDRLRLERVARQTLEDELSAPRSSRSWTLTAPLRAATRGVRALMSWQMSVALVAGPERAVPSK